MRDRLKEMLLEFHTAFEVQPDRELRLKLIREEKAELIDAAQHLLKEVADFLYVLQGAKNEGMTPEEIIAEVGDVSEPLASVVEGFGDTIEQALEIVHASNMSKLGDDGKPVRREDGKVLKGPNYAVPDLSHLLR